MLNHSRSSRVAIPSPPTRHGAEEQESYLLRLPVEIQIQICELVYEDVIVHILLRDKRLTHFVCPLRNPIHDKEGLRGAPVYLYEQCCCLGSALMPAFKKPPKMHDVRKSREVGRKRLSTRLSGLFFTCKQFYSVATEMLYTKTTFSFPTVRVFRRFAVTVPPQDLSLIQKMHLSAWETHWQYESRRGFAHDQRWIDSEAPDREAARNLIALLMTGLKYFILVSLQTGGGLNQRLDSYNVLYDRAEFFVTSLASRFESYGRKMDFEGYAVPAVEKFRDHIGQRGQWLNPTVVDIVVLIKRMLTLPGSAVPPGPKPLPEGWRYAWWMPIEASKASVASYPLEMRSSRRALLD